MPDNAPAWYVTTALEQLAAHSDAIAVHYRDRTISYGELLSCAHRTARVFHRHGLDRGDGLVLLVRNRPEAFTVRLAAHVLGLRLVPVFPDLVEHEATLRHVLTDARAAAVVFDPADHSESTVPRLAREIGVRSSFSLGDAGACEIDLAAASATEPDEPLPVRARADDVARVLYTGGTTGLPKGVPATFAAMAAAVRSWTDPERDARMVRHGIRFLLVTPLAHGSGDAAFNLLRTGASVHVMDGFDPESFIGALGRAPAALSYLYPSWLYRLLDHAEATGADLRPLVFLSYGSAPITSARLGQALRHLGPNLMQVYASTEAPAITTLSPADHAAALDGRPGLLGSVGRPLPGVSVALRRADGTSAPVGEIGEVCVRGDSVTTGYWNRPDDEARTPEGWIPTGDLGRMDADGYLYLAGRLKDMIIVNGRNYYAQPIEDALAHHPDVREAAVIGVPDDRTGEAIHAFVATRGPVPDPDALRARVAERLPADAVPCTVSVLEELPTTALGKPDKKRLRASFGSVAG